MFDINRFEKALCTDDVVYIHEFLSQNNAIDEVDERTGYSAIFLTALYGSYKYLKLVINCIKNNSKYCAKKILNSKDRFDKTLLHYASSCNNINCVRLLLEEGEDPNIPGSRNMCYCNTPMHIACSKNNLEMLKLLIQYGGKVEHRDNELGITPLFVAVRDNALSCAEYLVSQGADIHSKSLESYTPLHYAQWGDIDKGTDCIEWLIKQGADLEAKTARGDTPLHIAAYQSNYKAIEVLLAHGADINVQNTSSGDTPLHVLLDRYDVSQGDYGDDDGDDDEEEEEEEIDLVELAVAALLKYHPNLELRNQEGETVLNVAVRHGNCVSTLLEHGADVNARSGFTGETALEYALRNRYRYLSGELYPYLDDDGKKKIDAMYAEEGWTSP